MMEEMFLSAKRPFFQSSMIMSLKSIDKKEYLTFANNWLKSSGRSIPSETFDYISDISKGTTWYIQAILHGIYEHDKEEINNSLVDVVVEELIEEQAASFENYLSWLTENQQQLLYAIASEGLVESPLSQKFISKYGLPATSSVRTALKALSDKQLISHSPNGYSVSNLFFARWLNEMPIG